MVLTGIDTRKALRLAREHGCTVKQIKGTGEIKVSHPSWNRSVVMSRNRKDCPRAMSTMLQQLIRAP